MPVNPFLVVLALAVLFGLSGARDVSKYSKGCAALGALVLIGMFIFAVAVATSHGKVFYNPFGGMMEQTKWNLK